MDNDKKRKLVWSSLGYTTELMMDLFLEDGEWADEEMGAAYRQLIKIKSKVAPQVID